MQPFPARATAAPALPHLHVDGDTCPWCEQEIPPEKLAEIRGKIAAREHERTQDIVARVEKRHELALASALSQERSEAAVREAKARDEAKVESERLLGALRAEVQQASSQKADAVRRGQSLEQQLEELKQHSTAEIEQLRKAATVQAQHAAQEAQAAAQAAARESVEVKEKEAAEAKAKADKAERDLQAAQQSHAAALDQQRSAMEKARDEALNVQRASDFAEKQKLLSQINNLQRDLEKKANSELGEGAEVILYDALRQTFDDDRIERIKKGSAGADVRHVVVSNGQECGTIIYDSKNHRKFLNEHVTKLAADQLAEGAEHAILSLHKFPAKASQLHIQDGVILANPARVVAVVTMIRQHLIQAHTLRLSGKEREHKTAVLYAFITSDRCKQLIDRIDQNAAALLSHQVEEQKWHNTHWEKQGRLLRSVQKVKGDLCREIDGIISAELTSEPLAGEQPS